MSVPRRTTAVARLARLGFADPARAELLMGGLGVDAGQALETLIGALATAADPDLALAALARMPPDAELAEALAEDPRLRGRLAAVLGVSAALGDHLARHPGHWRVLAGADDLPAPAADQVRAELLAAVGARPGDAEPVAGAADRSTAPGAGAGADRVAALRVAYRRRLLALAARDLTGEEPLDRVAAELADLAAAGLEAALAIARANLSPGSAPCRLAVIAMGKCGARELNYASDVDVIFVAEPAGTGPESAGVGGGEAAVLRTATQLAAGLIQVCSQSTPEGVLFPVDPNLRPEGRSGPLVRTLASHLAYYQRWAQTWEFQALLKARPVAGDAALGAAYTAAVGPLVWQAAQRENFVPDVQAMRRRVIGNLPASVAGRQLKLGPGGLRDIEFAVQLLQLVHGRVDESLREPATLPALAMLAAGGYIGRPDAADLASAYRFLRTVEHLLQLRNLRRTHTLPDDPAALRTLGRALRVASPGPLEATSGVPVRPDPAEELLARWREHAGQVQRLHQKLFYRAMLDTVASLPGEAARLTPQAAEARLEALGYADPAGALRHIGALTAGVSRRAAIQRTLLPLMLEWFADAPDPDAGLLAFRQVSDALGQTPWDLRLLRDDVTVAPRRARQPDARPLVVGPLLRQP